MSLISEYTVEFYGKRFFCYNLSKSIWHLESMPVINAYNCFYPNKLLLLLIIISLLTVNWFQAFLSNTNNIYLTNKWDPNKNYDSGLE